MNASFSIENNTIDSGALNNIDLYSCQVSHVLTAGDESVPNTNNYIQFPENVGQ